MYDQKTIIDNETFAITLKQFLSIVFSIGVSYIIFNSVEPYTSNILIAFVIIFEVFLLIKFKPTRITPLSFYDYSQIKRNTLSKEDYEKFIKYNIAEIQSRIIYRETLGLPKNEYLNQMIELLKNTQTESKLN